MQPLQELNIISQLSRKRGISMIKCFLTKNNLNNIEVLICKAIINSYINHDKVVSVNNMLREYNEMKEEIKNPKCDGYQRVLIREQDQGQV